MRKRIRSVGIFVNGFWFFIGIIGIVGIISVIKEGEILVTVLSKNFIVNTDGHFALKYIWYVLGISVILTIVDWIVYESPTEQRVLQQTNPDQNI